ncbi:MAG: serine/threonine protein kinase, partial [Neolewinella sp.]
MENTQSPAEVRARLNEDLANGKTIVLSSQELDDPSLREQLPQLLEDLSRSQLQNTHGGPRIPGHTMLGEIGQGGMSTVYLARQDNLGRHVAIKIAPRWLGGGDRARRMLVQEAHAMARLSHPNIVVIHDIIDVDDTFAIAMEWVDGRTLTSLLRTLPPHPCADDMTLLRAALGTPTDEQDNFESNAERHFARLIRDIARATQTVHDNDLLHLDIKPSNVLVRRDGTPLLADFGVTRDISLELDQTRTFAGTPVYAAPEQLRRDDKNISPRTDIYSLGVTLYEALARTQPLQGMDLPAIVRCIESGAMPPLSQKVQVSPDLENIVHKAIAPEPEHRYATATEFANDLDAYLEHRPVVARPLRPMQRVRRWARNEPWKAGLAGTLAVVLPLIAGLGIYLAVQWPSLVEADINSDRIQANRLKQDSIQRWLIHDLQTSDAIAALEEAAKFESTDSAIACILALANEEGWQHASDAIAKHANPNQPSLGMELFAKKVAERRSFFNKDEVEALHSSGKAGDLYLVALDQAFRARDDHLETSAKLAQTYLEDASLGAPQDPLLLGLIGWFAVRAQDFERYESSVRTMRSRWPNDPVALAWGSLAIEQTNSDRAKQLARDIIKMMPQHSRGYELLAGAEFRGKNAEAAMQALDRSKQAKAAPPISEALVLRIRAANGDQEAAQLRLELAQRRNDLSMELHSAKAVDPGLLKSLIHKIAEQPDPSPMALEQAYQFGMAIDYEGWTSPKNRSTEISTPSWLRYRDLYPDRKCILQFRFIQVYFAGKIKEAAAIAAQITALQVDIDAYSRVATRVL